jgi:hypothetical protein
MTCSHLEQQTELNLAAMAPDVIGQRSELKGDVPMSTAENSHSSSKHNSVSLDTWAVIAALLLALAVKFDILKNVSW